MRILQVITLYRPDFVGGATLVCERLARGLAARGHDVAVFCGRPDPTLRPYATTSWRIDETPVTGVHVASGFASLARASYRHPPVVAAFEHVLDDTAPDLVHVHSIQALGADLLAAAAARGLPVVLTMHDWWWYCVRLFLVDPGGFVCPPRVDPARCHCAPDIDFAGRRAFLDGMLSHATLVLAPSRFLADAIVANGFPRARVRVCPNGVDPLPRPVRHAGPLRFGCLGGADGRLKGLPTLLEAARELDVGGWELTVHGAPGAVIPPVVADRVHARPSFTPDALANVLGSLDCVIVPSLMRESFSLVTREALASGLPVITSDSGGPEEIVRHDVNGQIFATASSRHLARAMRRLVMEPETHAALAAGARRTTIPTVAAQVEQILDLYREAQHAVARPPSAGPAARTRHVAFVCGMDGAPLRYRVTNLCDQLALHGITSEACYWTSADVPGAIARSDLVIVYRVPMHDWLDACLRYARSLGCPVLFSCDDLVFDEEQAPRGALDLLPAQQRDAWLAMCQRYAQTLRACDGFLGSTTVLAAAARRLGATPEVIPNGLGNAQLAAAERAYKHAAGTPRDGTVRIAYLSGTTMHDLDFAVIEPALAAVLAAHPETRLRLVGYLRPSERLAPFRDRIERVPFVPWPEVFTQLADVDVNLAPLAELGAFNEAKSAVKYLEAAVMGVPTIASPTGPFASAIADGRTGVLARDGEWEAALTTLVEDDLRRRRLGNAARADAFLHHGPASQAAALLAMLDRTSASRVEGAPPAARGAGERPTPLRAHRYDLEPADALPGTAEPGRDAPSPFLLPGRAVGQSFRASADGLQRIDLCIGTDDLPHGHMLVVHVAERAAQHAHDALDAPDLRRAEIDTGAIANHAWIAAAFTPIEDSAGRTFYVWVEAVGATADDAVTLWTYVQGWGEGPPTGLHLDHRPAPGSLTFRTFHAPGRDRTAPAARTA